MRIESQEVHEMYHKRADRRKNQLKNVNNSMFMWRTESRRSPSGMGSFPSSRIQRARARTRFPPELSPIRIILQLR